MGSDSELRKILGRAGAVLNLIEATPSGITTSRIYEIINDRSPCDKRTIERLLDALEELGMLEPRPVDTEGNHPRGWKWKIAKKTSISHALSLTYKQFLALYLCKAMLNPFQETFLGEDLRQVFFQIECALGSSVADHLTQLAGEVSFEPGSRWGLGVDADVMDTIHAGIREGHLLELDYESQSGRRVRKIGPHFITVAKGNLYLIGEDLAQHETRTYAIPRVRQVTMLDEEYTGTAITSEEFFKNSFGIFKAGNATAVRLEFYPPVASFVSERQWSDSQTVVRRTDGVVEIRMNVALTPELRQWILGFSAHVKVL